MSVTLKQLFSVTVDANIPVRFLAWIKSAGTQVVVNEDTPLPVAPVGGAADNAPASGNPVVAGGVAVNPASLSTYTAGDAVAIPTDLNGILLVNDRKKTRTDDAVSADPKQYTTVSTATPATADATVFTLAAGEKGFIQNLSADAPLAFKLGASASTSSFNGVLACGLVADDGKGEDIVIDDFVGAVSVAKVSGTARYIAYKLS